MAHVGRLHFIDFKDREELVFAEFEEGIAFAAVEFLQIENILIKRDCLFDVIDFDGNVITTVNFNASPVTDAPWRARTAHFPSRSKALIMSALRSRISFRCTAASSSISFSPLAVS